MAKTSAFFCRKRCFIWEGAKLQCGLENVFNRNCDWPKGIAKMYVTVPSSLGTTVCYIPTVSLDLPHVDCRTEIVSFTCPVYV